MKFMLITADEDLAQEAVRCGVERIVIDMEVLGKAERQGHIDAHSAAHTFDDLRRMRDQLPETEIMVRINPLHSGSKLEIDKAVAGGADRIMLPMFHTAATVRRFLTLVAGRVPSTLLAETSGALTSSRAWVPDLGALDQVHFGLNDLALSMGLDFLFEPLLLDILARPAAQLQQADIDFGVGGIGRLGREAIPAERLLGEYIRLGSSWTILSRAFHAAPSRRDSSDEFGVELERLRSSAENWAASSIDEMNRNSEALYDRIVAVRRMNNDG